MPIISVQNVSKRYRLGQVGYRTLREDIPRLFRKMTDPRGKDENFIWALKNVSFEVNQGERLGIIGPNGAGKTTLLRLLAGITSATEGRISVRGSMGVLIELQAGFHPELTGRENIYLNGSIMGMSRKEIARKFDEIVAFAELKDFIDTPIKRYSSGMQVRLGFAVAAHLEPDILIVDEVLAVGDYKFQRKCLGKMEGLTEQGRTVLFVSHNMRAISQLCTRAILLIDGRIQCDGDTETVIRQYIGAGEVESAETTWSPENAPGNQSVRLLGVHVRDKENKVKSAFSYTEPISICVTFLVLNDTVNLYLRMYLQNDEGVNVLVTTELDNTRFNKGVHEAKYTIAPHILNEGRYSVEQVLFKEGIVTSSEDVARVNYPVSFSVSYSGKFAGGLMRKHPGIVRPDQDWEISKIK